MSFMCPLVEIGNKLGIHVIGGECNGDRECCLRAVKPLEKDDQEKVLFPAYRDAIDPELLRKLLETISAVGLTGRFSAVFYGGVSGSEEVGL